MRKYLLILIFILLYVVIPIDVAYAEDDSVNMEDKVQGTLDDIDFDAFDDFLHDNINTNDLRIDDVKTYLMQIINGEKTLTFDMVMDVFFRYIFHDISHLLPLVIMIVSISILLSVVSSMSSKFAHSSTTEVLHFVCYVTIIVAVVSSVTMLLADAIKVIGNMYGFMEIIFPILVTLMASLGGVVTVSSYKPLMATLTFFISAITSRIIIPIFIATIVLCIVGHLSNNIKLDKLTKAIRVVGEFILGMIFSLFTTFVTIEGITGSSIDNVSIKSAKFAISSYVPILGGYLSDGFDLALASCVLIKNALGFVGIIVMLVMIIGPVVNIAVFSLILKLTAGIIEPITDSRISGFVYSMSKNMTLLIAIILGIAFMFLIMCMMIILSLNAVV